MPRFPISLLLAPLAPLALVLPAVAADPPARPATTHAAPRPLHPDATTAPWPHFLGPGIDATSPESHLLRDLDLLTLLWEFPKGDGYASPTLADGRLVLFHRVDGDETIDCLHPETGATLWSFSYPIEYTDRYGYSDGPRGAAMLDAASRSALTLGVTGQLHCLDLHSGEPRWSADLAARHGLRPAFFGLGPAPLIRDGVAYIHLGAADGTAVLAFDLKDGRQLWATPHRWGACYASPSIATLHGKEILLIFAGGESRPTHGGLLLIDPADGTILSEFPWRAEIYESVNASNPVVIDDSKIYLSECYGPGGVLLEIDAQFKPSIAWRGPEIGTHWMTPLAVDGHLYAFPGRHQQTAALTCTAIADGSELWRQSIGWQITPEELFGPPPGAPASRRRTSAPQPFQADLQRASLIHVDGDFLALGELGTLAWLDLSPDGHRVISHRQLFLAPQTWSAPAVHRGLLYIAQHDRGYNSSPRILCYDLRAPHPETPDTRTKDQGPRTKD
jgi:outer membrane protein assembly factor BamB